MKLSISNIQLETIISRIKTGTLNLQPDFQRGEVWTLSKQKKLIDSILRGWRIPPVHVVVSDDLIDEVLDGQQRLVAIRDFCNDRFPIDGKIEPFSEKINSLNGLYYSELPDKIRLSFLKYDLSFITLTEFDPSEPAELFDRLNQPLRLTSAEQRNAYVGETRNQIKKLVDYFEKAGASKDTIGFSNSRLAYDEIIAKFCYAIEIKTLRQKIVASDINDRYRKNKAFSETTIQECQNVLMKFMNIILHYNNTRYKLKVNKATIYSWFVFIKRNHDLSEFDISSVMYAFEVTRDYLKGKLKVPNNYQQAIIEQYEKRKQDIPSLEAMINIFNQRSSMGSTDALSIIYRDIILYIYSRFEMGYIDDIILCDFNEHASDNVSSALEYIYNKYKWGENF